MARKPVKPPPRTPDCEERAFEEILKANDEIADEGEPLKPAQTHRYEKGKPVRQRFTLS